MTGNFPPRCISERIKIRDSNEYMHTSILAVLFTIVKRAIIQASIDR